MKKLITIFGIAAVLTSCGGGSDTINLNNPESNVKIQELANKNFGEGKEIYALTLETKDHLTSELKSIDIDYLEDGIDYNRNYNLANEEGKKLEEPKKANDNFQTKFFLKNKQGKIKLKDLDFTIIHTKYNEALMMIPEGEYEKFTLHSWEYIVNNSGEITAEFVIEGTKVGEGTSVEGRNIVTNYYEFPFVMNAKKEVAFDD